MIKLNSLIIVFLTLLSIQILGQDENRLHIKSVKEVGQIEVGSPYVGIEIHKSFPMLNRISFYYPVANSIDISTDYWKRENFRIMSMGLKVGDLPKKILKNEVFEVDQTPYSVSFTKEEYDSEIKISYEFCKNEPAMVVTYLITNKSESEKNYEVYTRLETVLRTSHTYNLKDKAYTRFEKTGSVIRVNYPEIETGNCQVFIANAGELPTSFTTAAGDNKNFKTLDSWWLNNDSELSGKIIPKENPAKPIAAFIYNKKLEPNESIKIVQLIGSSLINEGKRKTDFLLKNYKNEVRDYENFVISRSVKKNPIITGNNDLDFTSIWSKAVLEVNAHYIDGQIEPMPAPAEYNFYFTHDVLLTDLAAVNFDLKRVKKDLKFIISHADTNKIIPHAYYWKDSLYKTEFAGTENWNHFWFTLVCARYLRHSNDKEFLNQLYPYIKKSIETALKNKGDDDLMWSFRPDWWDIGNNLGPRAYMTILAIRGLREFNFISALLESNSKLQYYEELANRMNKNLVDSLWDDKLNYLISYFEDGTEDKHIYMGSLLASHFGLLDNHKNLKLIETAKEKLLDDNLGIYTLFPMDLNKLIDYMKFAGNEAGDPYYYANGGIWPHGNAWYALGLISNGFNKEALNFIKRTMTLKGIMNSPNGQPALYEYRISDKNNPDVYGKIDKPQFLWAGGWYLYTLYNLFGLRENEWNIAFQPYLPKDLGKVQLTVNFKGNPVIVEISKSDDGFASITYDNKEIPSAIIPQDIKRPTKIIFKLGDPTNPYLNQANAEVISPVYNSDTKTLEFSLRSFKGHLIEFEVISPLEIKNIFINSKKSNENVSEIRKNNLYSIKVQHQSQLPDNQYTISFK